MNEIHYDFVDLDSEAAFQLFGQTLGGVSQGDLLVFDNQLATGKLTISTPENGLWMRKWTFTVFQKILLHKRPAPAESERKFILIYFLNPEIFGLKHKSRKIQVKGAEKNIFLTSKVAMDFTVLPNQPFYVLDIAFTEGWLQKHFIDAEPEHLSALAKHFAHNNSSVVQRCCVDEYTVLDELENASSQQQADPLFIRSRVYNLIILFLKKLLAVDKQPELVSTVSYEQLMHARSLINDRLGTQLNIKSIAREVNMSVASLSRQFKKIYGKSISEYHLGEKMEWAKKIIIENDFPVKEVAMMLGYHQPSSFIDCFSKYHGFSPGTLRAVTADT
ncbi:AraC family transcriptional regulator [Segetibacter sp. 3557_3]|uniref:helix-turn-helix domain-containing protein n=1 Tax=Segetibacter sp. 3557_3 TaxID=2547429 RepID=UPI00105850EE|nr:AraC family transcriptional regulator [Segetibacter sp. 3557_3]TDH24014.1 AraC family transcriptional regulator [Segetibacter sp. 3557_3]